MGLKSTFSKHEDIETCCQESVVMLSIYTCINQLVSKFILSNLHRCINLNLKYQYKCLRIGVNIKPLPKKYIISTYLKHFAV
jgi:hypothetical protein